VIQARRDIIERCLYGVDINPMAVEMAKLSLWLVSMDPHRPFTFLDDRLITGDSLLGITSLDQLEVMHLDAAKGRALHDRAMLDFTAGVRTLITDVADQRRKLAGMPGDDLIELDAKRHVLDEIREKTDRARLFADLTVGATLAHAGRGERAQRDAAIAAAYHARLVNDGALDADERARDQAARWLATDQPEAGFDRHPLHWPLEFPEVFERGGFDAIIGNPPFLGGPKLAPTLGSSYREYLLQAVSAVRGTNIDIIAYFVVRIHDLLALYGQAGFIATNTLAQGDTRAAGLVVIVDRGIEIRQAIKSERWPSRSAVLEYCAVWTSRDSLQGDAQRTADGLVVPSITASLERSGRARGEPHRLSGNRHLSYLGHHVNGMGFVLSVQQAEELLVTSSRNKEVVFPYLNGEDVNSRPHTDSRRYIINFRDWDLATCEKYAQCIDIVRALVKPEREKRNRASHRRFWWRYADYRRGLEEAIAPLDMVIVITLVSKVVMPVIVPTGQVFAHKLGVFATDDRAMLALLSSAPHYWWAISRSSTMKADLNYSPTDVFETLARPVATPEMRALGERLDSYRRDLMLARQASLTQTYNLVHDPRCSDQDIAGLRDIHRKIDEAVVQAYGWEDLLVSGLGHGFHETRQGVRYTVGPVVRQEILDRLLELNHERYVAEQRAKAGGPVEQKGLF
jgi:hypothetical protein